MKSYDEVLAQIQALSPEERVDVVRFQEHRQSSLPPVLWGEDPTIAKDQQIEAEGSKGSAPGQEEQQDKEEKVGGPKQEPEVSGPSSEPTSVITPRKYSKQVDNPIASINPLQSAKEILDAGWIFF